MPGPLHLRPRSAWVGLAALLTLARPAHASPAPGAAPPGLPPASTPALASPDPGSASPLNLATATTTSPPASPPSPATSPAPPATSPPASPATAPATASTPAHASTPATPVPTRPAAATSPPPAISPPPAGQIPPEPPRDPNDAPFMRAPNNQPQRVKLRTSPDLRRGYSSVRRLAVTVAPVFASFRMPFVGRPDSQPVAAGRAAGRTHGVGLNLEVDVQVLRWLWLRAQGSYSVHPVGEARALDADMKTIVTAGAGNIRALGFGAGPVLALDLGRFIPLIEGGLGGLRVAPPAGVAKGQLGKACDAKLCDAGLTCGADNLCHQGVIAEVYFGGAVDVLVRKHLSFGAQFRYYALLTAPGKFPVYLIGGVRLSVRF